METPLSEGPAFWKLLGLYARYLQKHDPERLLQAVLPTLDDRNFFETCNDLQAFHEIAEVLISTNVELPDAIRQAMAEGLIERSLDPSLPSHANERFIRLVTPCFRTAKEYLHNRLEAMVELVDKAICSRQREWGFTLQDGIFMEKMLLAIHSQPHLDKFVCERPSNASEKGRLEGILESLLQSPSSRLRQQALNLIGACCFSSFNAFLQLQSILDTSLELEDFEIRLHALKVKLDIIFLYHDKFPVLEVQRACLSHLFSPSMKMQAVAVVGIGRLLLHDCFEDVEPLLSEMLERYVYKPPEKISEDQNAKVTRILRMFFQEYSAEKSKHQDEICNTVVYKTLEEMRKGCLVVLPNGKVGHGVKSGGAMHYREFCLAIKFALSFCGDMTSAIAESLSVNMPVYQGKSMSKEAFSSWLTAL